MVTTKWCCKLWFGVTIDVIIKRRDGNKLANLVLLPIVCLAFASCLLCALPASFVVLFSTSFSRLWRRSSITTSILFKPLVGLGVVRDALEQMYPITEVVYLHFLFVRCVGVGVGVDFDVDVLCVPGRRGVREEIRRYTTNCNDIYIYIQRMDFDLFKFWFWFRWVPFRSIESKCLLCICVLFVQ